MKLVWGEPANPGELSFKTGSLFRKDQAHGVDHWVVHPLRKWFGITINDRIFIGLLRFNERMPRTTEGPRRALEGDSDGK